MKTTTLNIWGEDVEIGFSHEKYQNNGNLAIQAWCVEDGCFVEPYCMVTVNLRKVDENHAFIDSNNCPKEIINWLTDNGYAKDTNIISASGFCLYHEYEFNNEFLTSVVA